MKLLLGENLPHDLRHKISGHEVFTVKDMGWNSLRNGELLRQAASAGFDAFITLDSGIAYQQNLATLPIAVVILEAQYNTFDDLLPLVPALLRALTNLQPCTVTRIP